MLYATALVSLLLRMNFVRQSLTSTARGVNAVFALCFAAIANCGRDLSSAATAAIGRTLSEGASPACTRLSCLVLSWQGKSNPEVHNKDYLEQVAQSTGVALEYFGCRGVVDAIDWRRLFQAYHGWVAKRKYSFIFETVAKLANFFDEDGRTSDHKYCFFGLFVTRLIAIEMSNLEANQIVTSSHDWTLVEGFDYFKNMSWPDVANSPYGRVVFMTLARYSEATRTACPFLVGAPGSSKFDFLKVEDEGGFHCSQGTNRKYGTYILKGPADGSDGWCAAGEPDNRPHLKRLWDAVNVSLNKGSPVDDLAEAVQDYMDLKKGCGEADSVAMLAGAWLGLMDHDEALERTQFLMAHQSFQHAIFTRWQVWELLSELSAKMHYVHRTKVKAMTCFNYEPCHRTVAFYRRSLKKQFVEPCAAVANGVTTNYFDGVLGVNGTFNGHLIVSDVSSVKQRLTYDEVNDFEAWHKQHIKWNSFSSHALPVAIRAEGIRIGSVLHNQTEVHMEPQRKAMAADKAAAASRQFGRGRRPSIYMLILESASRTAFEAYCPRTAAFLRGGSSAWRSFEFPRFHAQDGTTAENMLPALSGFAFDRSLSSLRRKTWSCTAVGTGVPKKRFLWNILRSRGYVTGFGSTGCNGIVGTRYCKDWLKDFDHVPPALEFDPNCRSQNEWYEATNGSNKGCKGSRRPHEHYIGYFERLFEIYDRNSVFAYLHIEAAHESVESLQILDIALKGHLEKLFSELPAPSRPIMMLAGDHGPPDQCDQRTPLAVMLVPQELLVSNRQWMAWARNLERNHYSIATWFDFYATVLHLTAGAQDVETYVQPIETGESHVPRSLLAAMPPNRTCRAAGIQDWYCGCSQLWQPMCPIGTKVLRRLAGLAIDSVNKQNMKFLRQTKQSPSACPTLAVRDIISCEGQSDTLLHLQSALEFARGEAEAILRITFDTEQGMTYDFYADIYMKSATGNYQDLFAEPRVLHDLNPKTRYKKHEHCTPEGADPAFCACGGSETPTLQHNTHGSETTSLQHNTFGGHIEFEAAVAPLVWQKNTYQLEPKVYAFGLQNTNTCPSGYDHILDESEARAAAASHDIPTSSDFLMRPRFFSLRPKGCFKWVNGVFYFNPSPDMPSNPQGTPVCKLANLIAGR